MGRAKNSIANEFPRGRGKIKCAICGTPVANHESLGPCPKAPNNVVYISERVQVGNISC